MEVLFGDRLKALRKERDLQQSQLGEIFGLSPSAIGSYERNLREPAYKHLCAFAKYFGVSLDYLLGQTDERITVEEFSRIQEFEYFDLLNKYNVSLSGYTLDSADKQRLFDIAMGLLWSKVNGSED